MKTIFIACASLTSAYAYLDGLVVPAHHASSAVIKLRFPTKDKLAHFLNHILQNQSIKKDISSQVSRVPSHPRCRHARIEESRTPGIRAAVVTVSQGSSSSHSTALSSHFHSNERLNCQTWYSLCVAGSQRYEVPAVEEY